MRLDTAKKRFFSKVLIEPKGCWEWQASVNADGYGWFHHHGEHYAHRFSFMIHHGPLLEGMCVLHKCDNPPCVNPKHLFIGNRDTNNKDRAKKGRTVIFNSLKTHCKHGHLFDKENTYFRPNGVRFCRACARNYQNARNRK